MGKMKTYLTAPRWAKVPSYVKRLAFNLDLELNITVDVGILTETVYIRVSGDDENIKLFAKNLEDSVEEFNAR